MTLKRAILELIGLGFLVALVLLAELMFSSHPAEVGGR